MALLSLAPKRWYTPSVASVAQSVAQQPAVASVAQQPAVASVASVAQSVASAVVPAESVVVQHQEGDQAGGDDEDVDQATV